MPVKILSGGGKSTKDATAIPGDVRSGKTFYGADGKQTGIWTPKVTDYTMDATLQPENAPLGEVFYNNLGRQVGTGEKIFSEKSFIIPTNSYGRGPSHLVRGTQHKIIDDIYMYNSISKNFGYAQLYDVKVNCITGVTLNGQRWNLMIPKPFPNNEYESMLSIGYEGGYDGTVEMTLDIMIVGEQIWVGGDNAFGRYPSIILNYI